MSISNPVTVVPTREIFARYGRGDGATAYLGNLAVMPCLNGQGAVVNLVIPHDFSSLVSAVAILYPIATKVGADFDISSDYCGVGEVWNFHTEADNTLTPNFVIGERSDVDITSVLSALSAGDMLGIRVLCSAADSTFRFVGIKLRYN